MKTTTRDNQGRFTTRPMHRLRKLGLREQCPVCGAGRFMRCVKPTHEDLRNQAGKAYAEFRLLAAVSDLKEIDPDHILVRAIELVLESAPVTAPGQRDLFANEKLGQEGA